MSLSQEGHVVQPQAKKNKMSLWVIILIIFAILFLVVVCCLIMVAFVVGSMLYLTPQDIISGLLETSVLWL